MLSLEKIVNIHQHVGDKTALITDEITLSWDDYEELVKTNVMHFLNKNIIGSNTHRAIIISENTWEQFVLFSTLNTAGVVNSGIDYTMSSDKQIAAIQNSSANVVFYSNKHKPTEEMISSLDQNITFYNIENVIKKNILNYTLEDVFENVKQLNYSDDIVGFSFTSGTTGTPKCIYRTSSFAARRMPIFNKLYGFNSEDIFLVTMPFYHVSVKGWAGLILNDGGTLVFGDFTNPNDLVYKINNFGITSMLITPPVLASVIPLLKFEKYVNETMKFIMVGGKNFPANLKSEAINVFGPIVNEYYGSSETGINTLANSQDMVEFPSASGKLMEGSKIVILNDDNEPQPIGSIGRVAIDSFQNAAGYTTKEMEDIIFDGNRYIITADYGYINHEGYIFITQRSLFNGNSIKVDLYKLENTLRMLKHLQDVTVIQKDDDDYEVFVEYHKNILKIQKAMILDTISIILKGFGISETKVFTVDKIEYSLSGKVKYGNILKGEK